MSNKKKNYSKISTEKAKAEQNVEAEIVTSIDTPAEPVVETVETPTPKFVKGVVTGCARLNVRYSPSTKADVVTTINKGAEVEVEIDGDKSTKDFYYVRKGTPTEGFNGWCMKQYISIVK